MIDSSREGLAAGRHRWAALPVILAGTFMVVLDFFIINVAIPSMQRELRASSAAIQWVVAGYGLAYAAGLITAGRLGDIYGRRLVFAAGLALFTLASAGCALAPTPAFLVAGRVAQGMSAALLSPQVLSMLGIVYAGPDRARAFTAYGLTLGLAAVGGQLIGGLLMWADVAGLGWRTCFLINLPVGAGALLLTPRLIPELRPEASSRLDLVGAALVTLSMLAVVLPLVQGRELGWPAWTWQCLAASVPLLLVFGGYQRWLAARSGTPLIDLTLFRERAFTVGIVVVLVFWAGIASFFLVFALFLQVGNGLSPLVSGVIFTAVGTGFVTTSMLATQLTRRLGRQALGVGALVLAAGLIALDETVAYVGTPGRIYLITPALLVDGAGMGMVMAPLTSTVLAGISPRQAGAASGVLTTAIQVGNAVGVAIIGIIFYGSLGAAQRAASAYPRGFGASLIYLICLAIGVAILVQLLPREPGTQRARSAPPARAA